MVASAIDAYRGQIEKELHAGNATKQTHRAALETLIESLASGVTATNEPKRVECGAPDFAVTEKRAPCPVTIGHLETKSVASDLEFHCYINGEDRHSAGLARATGGAAEGSVA